MGIPPSRPHGDTRDHHPGDDGAHGRSRLRRARRAAGSATEECCGRRGRARDPVDRRALRWHARLRELARCGDREGRCESLAAQPGRCASRGGGSRGGSGHVAAPRGGCQVGSGSDGRNDGRAPGRLCCLRAAACCEENRAPIRQGACGCKRSGFRQPGPADARLVAQGLCGSTGPAPEGRAAATAGHEPRSPRRPPEAVAGATASGSTRPGEEGRTGAASASTTAPQEGVT